MKQYYLHVAITIFSFVVYYVRPNIYLEVQRGKATVQDNLLWYVDMLRAERHNAPKAIIFCW